MAFVPPKDRVLEYSASNSQSVFDVTGAPDASYNPFSSAMSVGDTTFGGVVEPGVAFKSGILTYSNTGEVTVSTVFDSKGTFSSSGTKQVFMGMPAAEMAFQPLIGVMSSAPITVDFNSANTDNAILIVLPKLYTRFLPWRLDISGPSASLSTSTFGLFSKTGGAGGGGLAIVAAGTANPINTASDATGTNTSTTSTAQSATLVAASLQTPNTLQFRVGTAQGSAATAKVTFLYFPKP